MEGWPNPRSGRASELAASVLDDLHRSPTPYHAVDRAVDLLTVAGFTAVDATAPFPVDEGGRFLVAGGTLIAWWQPAAAPGLDAGFRIVGAHTDSPNLRVRTNADLVAGGFAQVGVEIYGGVLLNSWLDRDLGLAGRVTVAAGDGGIETRLFRDDDPILRIPQLAIHLDREIRDKGLKLDPQRHLTPLWALADSSGTGSSVDDAGAGEARDGGESSGAVRRHVASSLDVEVERILAWDLMAFDTQPPAVVGRDGDLYASARIDNLVSAFCAVRALVATTAAGEERPHLPVVVLYDHEEIGSQTATGAAGALLGSTLERVATAAGRDRDGYLAALAGSLVISADGAHATHPNYVDKHEPSHHIALNNGVVIKRNANQRYATDAISEAAVLAAADAADVPLQYYIHRNDLPCGSTIGPITAAQLGVSTVDLGAPHARDAQRERNRWSGRLGSSPRSARRGVGEGVVIVAVGGASN